MIVKDPQVISCFSYTKAKAFVIVTALRGGAAPQGSADWSLGASRDVARRTPDRGASGASCSSYINGIAIEGAELPVGASYF